MRLSNLAFTIGTFVAVLSPIVAQSHRPATLTVPDTPTSWLSDEHSPDLSNATVGDLQPSVDYIEHWYYYAMDLCYQYDIPFGINGTAIQGPDFHSFDPLTMHALVTAYVDFYNFFDYYLVSTCNSSNVPRPTTLVAPNQPDSWNVEFKQGPDMRIPTVFDLQQANWWIEEYLYYSMEGCDPYHVDFGQEGNKLLGPEIDSTQPITEHVLLIAMNDILDFMNAYFQRCMSSGELPASNNSPGGQMSWKPNFPSSTVASSPTP